MSMVMVQESPATKDCITTTSAQLSNACSYLGILKRVLYTPGGAQSLLQMHDVLHCGGFKT